MIKCVLWYTIVVVIEIIQSDEFRKWLNNLRDKQAKARILVRLDRMSEGNFGDIKPLGGKVNEARIHYGPGYRLYFMQLGQKLVIMLAGSDKSTQEKTIKRARKIAEQWR